MLKLLHVRVEKKYSFINPFGTLTQAIGLK